VTDPAVLDRILGLLPPGWKPLRSPFVDLLYSLVVGGEGARPGVRRYHVAYAGATRGARTPHLEGALHWLEASLNTYVGGWARRRIFVHAGVVGWRGRAIVIPGRSHSGKSRLVAALVRAGARYYSDEFAVLDTRGRVHPYAIPLMVRGPDGQRRHPIESLGGRTGRRPLPVGLVVVTRYVPERRWRPRAMTRGRAVLELLSNTLPARHAPDRALEVLSRVVERAPALKGVRGEADETVCDILDRWPRPEPVPAGAPSGSMASLIGG
jgi:hypothetical protein